MNDSYSMTMRAPSGVSQGWARRTERVRDAQPPEAREIWRGDNLNAAAREQFVARHSQLRRFCQQTFADIHRDFCDLNDLLALSDVEGRLICLHSSPEVLAAATRDIGLHCGIPLTESTCGSNAITLALRYHEAMISPCPDRQRVPFGNRATVAVPLLDAEQKVVGCVAIFNAGEGSLGEKLLLAKFIAREISRAHLQGLPLAPGAALAPVTKLHSAEPANQEASEAVDRRMEAVAAPPPPGVPERRSGDRRRSQRAAPAAASTIKLTRRQLQVLQLFAQGKGYKEIARDIGITSYKTVEEHLDAVREKLQVAHRRECIQKAMSLGLL